MRVLAIDVGTNSTLHLIADVSGDDVSLVERGIVGNYLGVGLGDDGTLSSELLKENRTILSNIVRRARESDCVRIAAVGTHALRKMVNRDEFITMAGQLGVPVTVISDAEESQLAWRGVFGIHGCSDTMGLLDLGGGSSELAVGKGSTPYWISSVPLGAVTLARKHFRHDPPTDGEVKSTVETVRNAFIGWSGKLPRKAELVGIAGTITSIAAVEHNVTEYKPGVLERLIITVAQVKKWRSRLLTTNVDERRAIPGMPPARAESIHAGVLMLSEILEIIESDSVIVSEKGVLFGLAQKIAE